MITNSKRWAVFCTEEGGVRKAGYLLDVLKCLLGNQKMHSSTLLSGVC